MKKKRLLIMLFEILLVIGFGFSFYTYSQNEIQPTAVYVFNKDLPVNTQVTNSDLSKVTIPASAVQSEFAKNPKDVIGKYVNSNVYAKQYVYAKQLVTKDETDPFESMDLSKLRKVSIPLSYVDGFAGNLQRGNKIDLAFTGDGKKQAATGGAQSDFKYSKVFLQDVYVYSVSTAEGYKFVDHSDVTKDGVGNTSDGQKISTSGTNDGLGIITLAMTLDQAEELSARMSAGKIRILGRFDSNQTYDSLGFVLGDFQKVFSGNAVAETNAAN